MLVSDSLPSVATPFAAALRRHGFSTLDFRTLFPSTVPRWFRPTYLSRQADLTPELKTLTLLFALRMPVSFEQASRSLGTDLTRSLITAGVLLAAEDRLISSLQVSVEADEILLASDWGLAGENFATDQVPAIGPAARTLARLTMRQRAERVLDMGTGTGYQAILAARHAGRVVATDICPRALDFARFNCSLNSIERVDFLPGSFFEPVAGQKFDLIVANPPFVISPGSRFTFRDSGLGADEVSQLVTHEAAMHLEEGGFASILVSWIHSSDSDWANRVLGWLENSGCDVWLIRNGSLSPVEYASIWLPVGSSESETIDSELNQWLDYYHRIGAGRIAHGAVVLRRRCDGRNWQRCETMSDLSKDAGGEIKAIFEAEDFLRTLPNDRAILERRFRLRPDAFIDLRLQQTGRSWAAEQGILRSHEGLDFPIRIEQIPMRLIGACDGTLPLKEILQRTAEAEGFDPDAAAEATCALAQRLVRSGLLRTEP
jgi:methylase of polypeptide subunit release factors